MEINKNIGCRAGRTIVVDPNKFDGMDSSNNISVPLEDLSIYVQLKTKKRSRTILQDNLSINTPDIEVRFIEGEDVSGRKVLTTRYTDLTTSLDNQDDNQSLGISSIDIAFNTSYAPSITINFIDLRGSSMFQNEALLNNKYSTLFQMPYPIFTLEIKGYYGLPVTYDLHMTKFNAKFNSKTGNFEITASFIGYTYAMLSDMLIGYLRAIPYTKLGQEKYDELRANNPYLLTLDELTSYVSKIDENIKKLNSTDPIVINYTVYKDRLETLNDFENTLNLLPVYFGLQTTEQPKNEFLNITSVSNDDYNKAIKSYNDLIIEKVKIFNDGNDKKFLETELISSNAKKLENLTVSSLDQNDTTLVSFVTSNGINGVFTILDVRPIFQQIETKRNELKKVIDEYQILVGEKLKTEIGLTLSRQIGVEFEPTIRNIVEIFTTSVEAFISVLFRVSEAALRNPARATELQKYTPSVNSSENSYDYPIQDLSSGVTYTYFPWPEYREKDEKSGFKEVYLGGANILENPKKVNELEFIDDLLNAFYASYKTVQDALNATQEAEKLWGPVNPIDTTLYGLTSSPLKRFNNPLLQDVINIILTRASIFMGVSNKSLNSKDLDSFANLETENIKKLDSKIVTALSILQLNDVIDSTSKINDVDVPILKELSVNGNNYYYYNFIFGNNDTPSIEDAKGFKLLPLNNDANSFNFNIDENNTKLFSENDNVFLTNYTASKILDSNNQILLKPDDGGVYLKIFTIDEFNTNKRVLPDSLSPSTTIIQLSDLELNQTEFDIKASNQEILPQFGSNYGLPEFFTLNIDNIGESPFRTMFFVDNTDYKGGSSICSNRTTEEPTEYDLNNKSNLVAYFRTRTFGTNDYPNFLYGSKSIRTTLGENRLNLNKTIKNEVGVSYPYISFGVNYKVQGFTAGNSTYTDISLFASRFYYAQTSEYARAFLFLHTFPWNGLIGEQNFISCIFKVNEIINTFGNKAGFVSTPRLWAAFVGGLLWRADIRQPILDDDNQQIGGGSGSIDPISFGILNGNSFTVNYIPNLVSQNKTPNRFEYLHSNVGSVKNKYSMSFLSELSNTEDKYLPIDIMLLQLPEQVKNEFKKVFFEFVNGSESSWNQIKSKLELVNNCDDALWVQKRLLTPATVLNNEFYINSQTLKNNYDGVYENGKKAIDNYVMISRYDDRDYQDVDLNYVTELKDNSDAVNNLLTLMKEEVIISNNSFKIWEQSLITTNENDRGDIFFPKETLDNYLSFLRAKLQVDNKTEQEELKEQSQQIFGTDNQNLIKFQLYRTCKNIYDKWIGGSSDESSIIFKNGLDSRNGLDVKLAQNRAKLKNGNPNPTLIDSFRFVTRSFADIGDKLYVNPKETVETMAVNPNSSFYDVVTSLLSANNFNFTPLPNYINYQDENELEKIFRPVSGSDVFSSGSTGPAFVCVYVGQPSKHLDLNDSFYRHDGIDFRCDNKNNLEPLEADDFTANKEEYENNVAVFSVNYSQQNQNIFKDITLDQSEFSETSESLQVIDEIAKKGAENRTTIGGQNLYDVYSVRSYKAEVEMMGNAMIQPMMYFQLNNIPMFHGGYLITNVKHYIRPNHMLTNFTGVRVRNVETPILDAASLYMPLLESILGSEQSNTTQSIQQTQSTADISIGTNCGQFTLKKPIVDGVSGFEKTKPIRDLVASVESNGNYDAYNNGIAGVRGTGNYKPSIMTIGEIKIAQSLPGSNRIFAVGKYQLIPITFNNMIKALGFNDNDIFNAEKQEMAGEWLILKGAGYRKGLISYFSKNSLGNEIDLQAAITDLALEFASMPTYFGTTTSQALNRTNPIGYNTNTSLYGGSAGNPSKAKFCAQDVAKALIQTWKNLNPNKQPIFDYSKIEAIYN